MTEGVFTVNTAVLEQNMETNVRATSPDPSKWQNPGPGQLDRGVWLSLEEASALLYAAPKTLRAHKDRIPHIVTLGRQRFFHRDLIMLIRSELLHGNDFDTALKNLGIEEKSAS